MSITIADVAAAAGVSQSTVSRALSDPTKVSAKTRAVIFRIVQELGYVPSQVARSLSKGNTGEIGLIVPDIANPFFPPIIKAVQARAHRRSRTIIIADSDERPKDEIDHIRMLAKQVDGLILASPRAPDETLNEVISLVPTVVVNRRLPGAPNILIDNADGINQAVEHLAALGHRRLCYLNGPRASWSNKSRQEMIKAACDRHEIELIQFGPFQPQIEAGVRAGDLVQASGVTAVIAYDDLIALGAMSGLAQRGLKIGVDVSIVGIDDSPMSGMAFPTLTSIHVPCAEAGSAAVDLLLDVLTGAIEDPAPVIELETRLVTRGSTGPCPK